MHWLPDVHFSEDQCRIEHRAQEHTAEFEHGAKAGNQSDKETKREGGIQTDYI